MKKGLVYKFSSFSYGSVINLLLGLVTAPVITRLFSPADLGKLSMFVLALSIVSLITIFGTDQAFSRFYYDLFGSQKRTLLYKIGKIIFPLFLLVLLVLIGFTENISFLLFENDHKDLIYILIIAFSLNIVTIYTKLIVRMMQAGNTYSILTVMGRVIRFGAIILLYYLVGSNFKVLIYSQVISIIIISAILLVITRRYWSSNKTPSIEYSYQELFKYSYPLALSTFVFWLFQSFDRLALKSLSSMSELGIYAGALQLTALMQVVVVAFSTYWVPLSMEKYIENKNNHQFFMKAMEAVTFIVFVLVTIIVMSKDLIILVLGPEFSNAKYLFPFLVFAPVMHGLSYITSVGINFTKKTSMHLVITSVSCVINIGLNLLLIPQLGALGAALATGVSYVILFYLYTYFSSKLYSTGTNLKKFSGQLILLIIYAFSSTLMLNNLTLQIFIGVVILLLLVIINKYAIRNLALLFMRH